MSGVTFPDACYHEKLGAGIAIGKSVTPQVTSRSSPALSAGSTSTLKDADLVAEDPFGLEINKRTSRSEACTFSSNVNAICKARNDREHEWGQRRPHIATVSAKEAPLSSPLTSAKPLPVSRAEATSRRDNPGLSVFSRDEAANYPSRKSSQSSVDKW